MSTNFSSENTLWTIDQTAQFLQVTARTVFELRKKGFPFIQLGGSIRFDPQKVKDYLSNNPNRSNHRDRRLYFKRNGGPK